MDSNSGFEVEDTEIVEDGTPHEMDTYWDKVPYQYASYAQIAGSPADMRILFGERLPPTGKVRPTLGVVMSVFEARAIYKALGIQLGKVDEMVKKHLENQKQSANE